MEVGQYDVEFIPRWAIKSQSLTDFIAEWTDSRLRELICCPIIGLCILIDITLLEEEGLAIQLDFLAINNVAGYKGLVT
jgi:hypothetical protein